MKFLIYAEFVMLLFIAGDANCQQYSKITYDAGTGLTILSGGDICADDVIINGIFTGTGTICSGPLPVELLSFDYSKSKNDVTIRWVTSFEINNAGFDIEKSDFTGNSTESWIKIGFIAGNGTTNDPKQYIFSDKKLGTGKYIYRIKQIDYNSNFEYFELGQIVSIDPPLNFYAGQNYPNPSNPKSKIDYEIPVNGKVIINLYNMLGQIVSNITDENREAGYYTVEFDGRNLASGVYLYRIVVYGSSQSFTKTLKMILVK